MVLQDHLENLVKLVKLVRLDFLVYQDLKETWEHLVPREAQDFKDQEVNLASLDPLACLGKWVHLVKMGLTARKEALVLQEAQALQVFQGQEGNLV